MRFMCSNCHHDHDVHKDSYITNPTSGTVVAGAWFKDERGQNHQATACLCCGTVHATTGSLLKAFFSSFSRLVNVKYYMTIEKLQAIVEKIARDDSLRIDKALGATGLPDIVLDGLAARGYLSFVEEYEDMTTSKASPKNTNEASPSKEELHNLCTAFARVYIVFCVVFDKDPNKAASLDEFVKDSLAKDEASESFMVTVSVSYAIDMGYLQRNQLFEVIRNVAQFTKDAGFDEEFRKVFQ